MTINFAFTPKVKRLSIITLSVILAISLLFGCFAAGITYQRESARQLRVRQLILIIQSEGVMQDDLNQAAYELSIIAK